MRSVERPTAYARLVRGLYPLWSCQPATRRDRGQARNAGHTRLQACWRHVRSSAMGGHSRLGSEAAIHQETPCNLVTFRRLIGPADLLRTTVVTRLARQAEAWRRTLDLRQDYAEGPTIATCSAVRCAECESALTLSTPDVLGNFHDPGVGVLVRSNPRKANSALTSKGRHGDDSNI